MKSFYVSDLDGTLLRSDATLSPYTSQTINRLVERGMLFSYATARSYVTATKATQDIRCQIPLIVYNGALVIDNATGKILLSNFLEDAPGLLNYLLNCQVYPIVYAYLDGIEYFSYLKHRCTPEMQSFLNSRKGDPRDRPVDSFSALCQGEIFYITCIDAPHKLEPIYRAYQNRYHCIYQQDFYTGAQWLEILSLKASKAKAIAHLKPLLNYDRLIVFGDGKNDIDMFQLANESYAVQNAHEELKQLATAIIGSNDEDGVARWLEKNG